MPMDKRIVRVGIIIGAKLTWYDDLNVMATGSKWSTPDQGICDITISNLARDTRERLQRECAPNINSSVRKSIILEVGRESYGTATLFRADIRRVSVTQPPDISLKFKCVPNSYNRGIIISRSFSNNTALSEICEQIAGDNGVSLAFEIDDKKIGSWEFSGSADAGIKRLKDLANADVYIDNNTMIVKEEGAERQSATVRILNKGTGMIGIPESTENGVKVTMLFDPITSVGGIIRLTSVICPQLDGDYIIYKLDYNITSREVPFYLTAHANFAEGRI